MRPWRRASPGAFAIACVLASRLLMAGDRPAAERDLGRFAPSLRIALDTPRDGAVVATPSPWLFVSGRVYATSSEAQRYDLVIAIDHSKSTDAPSGVDLDGDGRIGKAPDTRFADSASDDPGDNVLAAQIAASRTLLSQLDPETTRVAVLSFAGDGNPESPDAELLVPLTARYAAVDRALDRLGRRWPSGRTNLAAAIQRGTAELVGEPAAGSERASAPSALRPAAMPILILLTDGRPTLPVPFELDQNVAATLAAGRLAERAHVRIDTFGIGAEASRDPSVLIALSERTGGAYTAVEDPRELQNRFEALRLVSVESVRLQNRTTRETATQLLLEADGRFSALIHLTDGENRLEFQARSTDGSLRRRHVRVTRLPGLDLPALDARLMRQRARILRTRLQILRRRGLEIRLEKQRRALEVHLEALERARQGRPSRSLDVSVSAESETVGAGRPASRPSSGSDPPVEAQARPRSGVP